MLPKFYPILDTEIAARHCVGLMEAAEQILDGGAQILQLRHKGFYSREIWNAAERLAQLCRARGVPFVINDRADLAALLGAALHLGQDDLPPSAARRVTGAATMLGFSTHNERQLRAAVHEPADYLALGPIFGTASKLNPDPVVGLDELRRLRPLADRRPLVAIGGITRDNVRDVLAAGADSVAIIGDLFPRDLSSNAANLRARAEQWVLATSASQNI